MPLDRPAHGRWPSAATTVVGVIGDPVDHSLSPLLHNTAFGSLGLDWVSVGFRVPPGATRSAAAAVRDLGLAGLSVTMPHKSAMAELVDELDPVARRLGAVNCCVRRGSDVIGINTDGSGFLESLRRSSGIEPRGRTCLVAGAGGAARAVVLALAEAGAARIAVVARDRARAAATAELAGAAGIAATVEEAARLAGSADLVVNATPVGMLGGPAEGEPALVPADLLGADQVVSDLVYHPRVTPWLAEAERRGARVSGGLGMLVHQAAVQLERWTGMAVPVEAMWRAAEEAESSR